MLFKIIANFTGKHLCCSLLWYDYSSQKCNFIKKRLQRRLFPVKFAKFLRAPCFPEHLQWLPLKVLGFQHAILLKKRLWKRFFSVNFAKLLRMSFDRTPSGDYSCVYMWILRRLSEHFFYGAPRGNFYFMYKLQDFNHQIQ